MIKNSVKEVKVEDPKLSYGINSISIILKSIVNIFILYL